MSALGNKKIMAENIRHYMEKKGIDRKELCDALGLKYSTVTDWLNAEKYPRIDKIEMMANYFRISKADLVEERLDGLFPIKNAAYVPIIGSVRCGPGGPAYECIDEYISIDESFGRPEEIRGFRAEGDSMSGDGINDGDVCLVHLQDDVEDGQIAVIVLCNSYEPEGMIKRIRRDRGMVILQSSNPAYPPRIITGEEANAVHIIGRVVEVRHRY